MRTSARLGIAIGAWLTASGLVMAQPPAKVDLAALAERLVATTANVKENDVVWIEGGVEQAPFLEEIAVAVRKRGAHPIIALLGSDAFARKMIESVPEKYDTQPRTDDIGLAKLINVRIVIPTSRDPAIESSLPPARRAVIAKSQQAVNEAARKHKVRTVELGNDFTPTAWRAKLFGIPDADLAKMFWDGIGADYSAIEAKAASVKAALAAGKEVHITHPNGTDLTMKIKGRKVVASDGVISDADIKAGGANLSAWLPAGEVFVTPVPGTAAGKIVDDRLFADGKEISGLTVDVKAGKITAINAKSGWEAIKGQFDAAGPGKNEISAFDVGINPAVKTPGKFESWVGAGTVTIVAGNNTWAGGTNKEPFVLELKLNGATVMVDGKPLVENGTLK